MYVRFSPSPPLRSPLLPSPPISSPSLPSPPHPPQARSLGTKQISEDDLLEMIRSRPAGGTAPSPSKKEDVASKGKGAGRAAVAKVEIIEDVVEDVRVVATHPSPREDASPAPQAVGGASPSPSGGCMLWVDKYRPTSLKGVIGQQGPRSCASKLLQWLQDWGKNHGTGAGSEGGPRKKPPGGWGESQRARQVLVCCACSVHSMQGWVVMGRSSRLPSSRDRQEWARPPQPHWHARCDSGSHGNRAHA